MVKGKKKTADSGNKNSNAGARSRNALQGDAAMAAEKLEISVNKRATRSTSKGKLVEPKIINKPTSTPRRSRVSDARPGTSNDRQINERNRGSRSKVQDPEAVEFKEGNNIISMSVDHQHRSEDSPSNDEDAESSASPSESEGEDVTMSSGDNARSRSSSRSRRSSPQPSASEGELTKSDDYSRSEVDSPPPKRKKRDQNKKLKKKVKRMQKYLVRKGVIDSDLDDTELEQLMEAESDEETRRKARRSRKRGKARIKCQFDEHPDACRSPSEMTIYRRALPSTEQPVIKKATKAVTNLRGTPQAIDETALFGNLNLLPNSDEIDSILERSRGARRKREQRSYSRSRSRSHSRRREHRHTGTRRSHSRSRDRSYEKQRRDERVPSRARDTSRSVSRLRDVDRDFGLEAAEQHAEDLIREAEKSKARMHEVPGKLPQFINKDHAFIHSALVDQNYLTVASHISKSLKEKIQGFEYVDFSKLLPRDKVIDEDDDRMTWVNKGGFPMMVPASDREATGAITSITKWDQAFRVYSDILTTRHPNKINELLQYSHVISTAAQSYTWTNVYSYDRAFRIHISEYPARSWGVILQQAWNMRLVDKIKKEGGGTYTQGTGSNKQDHCRRFQRGKCTYGLNCIYEHRCTICKKWGHGAHICRKRTDYYDEGSRRSSQSTSYGARGSSSQTQVQSSRDFKPVEKREPVATQSRPPAKKT